MLWEPVSYPRRGQIRLRLTIGYQHYLLAKLAVCEEPQAFIQSLFEIRITGHFRQRP